MTTTGELHAIVEELELVDIGDAASYLGEEAEGNEEVSQLMVENLAFSRDSERSLAPFALF